MDHFNRTRVLVGIVIFILYVEGIAIIFFRNKKRILKPQHTERLNKELLN